MTILLLPSSKRPLSSPRFILHPFLDPSRRKVVTLRRNVSFEIRVGFRPIFRAEYEGEDRRDVEVVDVDRGYLDEGM